MREGRETKGGEIEGRLKKREEGDGYLVLFYCDLDIFSWGRQFSDCTST